VTTDDEALAARARLLKDLGLRADIRFLHDEIAFNYRMTNLQAAVGLGQLEVIEDLVERRRTNARHYGELLEDVPGLRLPEELEWAKNVYWMYGILVEEGFGASRDELAHELAERGVETRPFFIPMHAQPAFLKMGLFLREHYPVAEQVSLTGLYLPSGPGLTRKEIEQVCDALKEVYHAHAN
jgi:perosamine synthetase